MTAPYRAATLTKNLKLEKQGLEICPLDKPIVPKKGTGVLYADHLPTDKLRDKYRGAQGVRIDHIEGVDIVVGPSGLGDAVGSRRFNYVIASHVIEHIPNPLKWLNEIYELMEPGGILSLAIPDKHYCFDRLRRLTTATDWIGAWLQKTTRPTPAQILDALSNAVSHNGNIAWQGNIDPDDLTHWHQPREALRIAVEALNSDEYRDVNCWVFTPRSFCNLLRRLSVFGLLNFYVANFHDSVGHEFFVQLQKPEKFVWSEQIMSIPLFREGRYKSLPEDFDAKFYLYHYPDIMQTRVDPADHYLEYGRFEGRAVCEAPDQPRKRGVTLMRSELSRQRSVTWRYLGSKMVIRPPSAYVFLLDEPVARATVLPDASVKIRGWAYLEGSPLTLHVVVGEHEVAVASCEFYRPGVVHRFGDKTDGHVGFDLELPASLLLGQKVELRFTDSSGMVRAVHSLSFGSKSDAFRRMFLVHIPKTAGSSVNAFMEDCLGEDACVSHIEAHPKWEFGAGPDPRFEDKVFLSGHVSLYALRRILDLQNTLVATVLRDPIDQIISHIAWARRLADPDEDALFYQHDAEIQHIATRLAGLDLGSPAHLKKWASDLSQTGQSLFDNCQVRYLTDRQSTDRVTQRDLQVAIENLQIFDLIGRSDRVPLFLAKVAEKMRLERCSASDVNIRENVAKTKYGLDARDPRIREALEPLIHLDQVLYDKVTSSESVAVSV